MFFIVPVVSLFLAIIAVFLVFKYFDIGYKKKISRFNDRKDLTVEAIYDKYFRDENICKQTMIDLWVELAVRLEIPSGKLRPTDRFDTELWPEKGFEYDDQINDAIYFINKKCRDCGINSDFKNFDTIYDFIINCSSMGVKINNINL